jgi:hypothetical protein
MAAPTTLPIPAARDVMKETVRLRVMRGPFGEVKFCGPLVGNLGTHGRTVWSIVAENSLILR